MESLSPSLRTGHIARAMRKITANRAAPAAYELPRGSRMRLPIALYRLLRRFKTTLPSGATWLPRKCQTIRH